MSPQTPTSIQILITTEFDAPPEALFRALRVRGHAGTCRSKPRHSKERDGRTLLRRNVMFQSVEDRDVMMATGMEAGVKEAMDRLEELLATMAG